MPEPFSHSRLATFETCPRRYKFRYIDRLPRSGVGVEAHVGSAVHSALERLYAERVGGRLPEPHEVQEWYEEAWSRVRPPDLRIVRTGFDVEDYHRLGAACVEGYIERFHPFADGEVVGLEMRIDIDLPLEAGFRLLGYIDRLVRKPGGVYEIHDYKTSGSWPRPRALDEDRQLTLYEMGVRREHPEARQIIQVWHFLALGRTFRRERRPEDLRRVAKETAALIRRIESERTFATRPGPLCHWCDYVAVCEEGGRYIKANRPPGLAARTSP